MNFDELVLEKLGMLFAKYHLEIIKQQKNYVKLRSANVVIVLVRDERERSNALYAAPDESFLYPIDENVLKAVFDSSIEIDFVPEEVFINHLHLFFNAEGGGLLAGDPSVMAEIKDFIYRESKTYTDQMVMRQHLNAADKAWAESDYKKFITCIDNADLKQLPAIYEAKYKIAQQKLKSG